MDNNSTPLSPAAERVADLLRDAGCPGPVIQLAQSTRTAADAAAAIGCTVAQIAKSIVFRAASDRAVLVVASGPNRVDEALIAAALGQKIGKADAAFVRAKTGYAIGGVCPIGHTEPPHLFIDASLERLDPIWAAAGHPHAVFRTGFAELVRLTGGTVLHVGATGADRLAIRPDASP
jgi:prolyl-tRNA editing enzyme YbaK/EbsC (Cys-tRNA(Pro) deacylase)